MAQRTRDRRPARRPRRFASVPFAPELEGRLRAELAAEHAARPFRVCDPRDAARRVAGLLHGAGLETVFVRGALDLGGAELDHVWTVADGRVVDVTMPADDLAFLRALRAYVAGDLTPDALDALALDHPVEKRVLGRFGAPLAYVGLPVWGSQPATLS